MFKEFTAEWFARDQQEKAVHRYVEAMVRARMQQRDRLGYECFQAHCAAEGSSGVPLGLVVYGEYQQHWGFVCPYPKPENISINLHQ